MYGELNQKIEFELEQKEKVIIFSHLVIAKVERMARWTEMDV